VLKQLLSLRYNRQQEAEADEYSAIYVCATSYHAPSITGLFEKSLAEGGRRRPQFLSTHPNDAGRVEAMQAKIEEIGYSGTVKNQSGHEQIQSTLPTAAQTSVGSSEPPPRRVPLRPRFRRGR
jgi:predicted Zn-dependent protease